MAQEAYIQKLLSDESQKVSEADIQNWLRDESHPGYIQWAYKFNRKRLRSILNELLKNNKSLKRYKKAWYRLIKMYLELEGKLVDQGLDEDEKKDFDNVKFLKNRYVEKIMYQKEIKQILEEDLEDTKCELQHFKLLKEGWKMSLCGDKEIYWIIKGE